MTFKGSESRAAKSVPGESDVVRSEQSRFH